ncbi:MAG: hypothetical protein ACE5FH_02445 [Candidatus Zixiibacteriota bacterium]
MPNQQRLAGKVREVAIEPGQYEIALQVIRDARWSVREAEVGQKVTMKVITAGIEDGTKATLDIYVRDLSFASQHLATICTEVRSDRIEQEWELTIDDKLLNLQDEKMETGRYSVPFYYFVVAIDTLTERSGLLKYKDWLELTVKDEDGKALADKEYTVLFPNGKICTGTLDANGYVKIEKTPPGRMKLKMDPRS